MLASDPNGDAQNALSFSLASDIVELVIFTTDDVFMQTLREVVGDARRLWHVPSADKVSDLLLAGQVGILVLDVQALPESAGVFVTQIKRQFPELVVVVAGHRDAETSLASLISSGIIYRFIHKPMSPARAKLFADAAVKKHDEQRKRLPASPSVAWISAGNRWLLIGAAIGVFVAGGVAIWALRRDGYSEESAPAHAAAGKPPAVESALLTRAAAALAANRLTAPSGDDALDLYSQELARNPADAAARAGLAEVHERLLARAENALLEERLDEAATAIETARKAGVESARIAFLAAQLTKSREQLKRALAQAHFKGDSPTARAGPDDQINRFLGVAAQRMTEGRLIDPGHDSARFYVQEALRIDPDGNATQAAKQTLAIALLAQAQAAIDRRDFADAAGLLDAADGIAAPSNVQDALQLLGAARKQVDTDAWAQLLKNAEERLQQDRLIEPANDSAKYYLLTLRGVNPGNAGLATALQDFGLRVVAKARRALSLQQYDAARSWLDELASVGFSSADSSAALREVEAAVSQQHFLANVVGANELTLVRSVKPIYPPRAERAKTEGWVELEFTVSESGEVKDIAVHAANPTGVFDNAAIGALSQWRYKPVLRDAKPAAQRSRIRMRFALTG